MTKGIPPRRTLVTAVGGAVAAAAVALGIGLVAVGGDDGPKVPARESARGFTDKVTVPMYAPNQFRPSVPRPAQLPPLIRSTGPCKVAMDAVRDFQDRHLSGLVLTPPQATELGALMRKVDPAIDPGAACSDDLAQRFRLQELEPWQTWQPPAGAAAPQPAASPTAKAPATDTTPGRATPSASRSSGSVEAPDPAHTDEGTETRH